MQTVYLGNARRKRYHHPYVEFLLYIIVHTHPTVVFPAPKTRNPTGNTFTAVEMLISRCGLEGLNNVWSLLCMKISLNKGTDLRRFAYFSNEFIFTYDLNWIISFCLMFSILTLYERKSYLILFLIIFQWVWIPSGHIAERNIVAVILKPN